MTDRPKIIVGISGASGAVYGVQALKLLGEMGVDRHLILSDAAELTLRHELDLGRDDLRDLAEHHYDNDAVGASPASGSFRNLGMIVAPCSVRSLSEIASGVASTLLTRAADVTLKERRRLVLMLRETPLHLGHIRAMAAVTEMGGVIAPPVPSFYAKPQSIEEMVAQTVGRALDLFGLEAPTVKRWSGLDDEPIET